MEIVVLFCWAIYFGLLYELFLGWSSAQDKKFYKKLFVTKVYLVVLFISALLLAVPIWGVIQSGQFMLPVLAMPFVYLILFQIINKISLLISKRNLIIVGGSDKWPKEHKWYVDSILHFVAVLISIVLPILISIVMEGRL